MRGGPPKTSNRHVVNEENTTVSVSRSRGISSTRVGQGVVCEEEGIQSSLAPLALRLDEVAWIVWGGLSLGWDFFLLRFIDALHGGEVVPTDTKSWG